MVPTQKSAARKAALPTWLILAALGLAATAGGLFLPRSLRSHTETPAVIPGASETLAPTSEKKESLQYTPPSLPDLPSPGSMLLRLTLGTVFVLILCVVTLWAGKRWIRPLAGPVGENKQLQVLEALTLGGRCSIYLLQAGEAKVLAGVDHAGIKALLPLPAAFAEMIEDKQYTTEIAEKTSV